MELRTQRLLLRRWRAGDADAMAAINRDPEVARYLNRPVGSEAFLRFVNAHWQRHGFGFWALESLEPETAGSLLGFAGVAYPDYIPELAGRPELGWRLARAAWGRGLAFEAMRAALDDCRARIGLRDLIAVIHPRNERSRRLAGRLGMSVERRAHNPWLCAEVEVWSFPSSGGERRRSGSPARGLGAGSAGRQPGCREVQRTEVAHLVDPSGVDTVEVLGPTLQFLPAPAGDNGPCVLRGAIPPRGVVPLHSQADPDTFRLSVTADGFAWLPVRRGDVFHVPGSAKDA